MSASQLKAALLGCRSMTPGAAMKGGKLPFAAFWMNGS